MLTTRTAYGDSQVVSILGGKARRPFLHKLGDIFEITLNLRDVVQKFPYLRVATGFRSEQRFPVRVGEAACIEREVGIKRNAVLVTEGQAIDRHPVLAFGAYAFANQFTQLMHIGMAGVDDQVRPADDRAQQVLFQIDGFDQGMGTVRQWVLAAGFAESLQQSFRTGLEEQDLKGDSKLSSEL